MLYYAILYYTILYYTILYYTVITIPYYTMDWRAVPQAQRRLAQRLHGQPEGHRRPGGARTMI